MANRRERKRLRLASYDYSTPGAYFVTIVTRGRIHLFGEVASRKMALNPYGQIVEQAWRDLPHHYPHVILDAFVVMPNHVHGIIVLTVNDADAVGVGNGFIIVGDGLKPSPTPKPSPTTPPTICAPSPTMEPSLTPTPPAAKPSPMRRHGLPEIVRAFKAFSARRINEQQGTPGVPVWQRGYHDHIIRNKREWTAIRAYIGDNPHRWAEDRENLEVLGYGE